jgi:hypothetical protein
VSNFEQTATANERMRVSGMLGHRRVPMSITDQFWQYAKEAILSASYAKTDEDRQGNDGNADDINGPIHAAR